MNAQLPASVRFDIQGLANSMRLSSALDAVPLKLARDPVDFRRGQGKMRCFGHEGSIRSL